MRHARTAGTFLEIVERTGRPAGATLDLDLVNRRTARILARRVEPAFDPATRRKGLLGRDGLAPGAALILAPCSSIHTFFMRFPIDVLFADRDGRVVKALRAVPAWRLGMALRAFAAIELPAGAIARTETVAGDRLVLAAGGRPE